MPNFIPGLKLCEGFFHGAVKPVLEAEFPELEYAAALIGSGSEVLGFDTEMSSDHHWGPRAMLFMSTQGKGQYEDAITETMKHKLPYTFQGYSTNFGEPIFTPSDHGTQLLETVESGPVNHRVEIYDLHQFFASYLGIENVEQLSASDWLTMPGQNLRAVTAGAVYHDGPGKLTGLRTKFTYYPNEVWLYMLLAGWARIGQEEHFLGRTGYVGDELGSRLIGARLVHDLMNLCFLIEKEYAPYSKWFGTAFAKLDCAKQLTPLFNDALSAQTWQVREKHLCAAYQIVAKMHNDLGITEPIEAKVSSFHGRPFMVIHGELFTDALRAQISDPIMRRIAENTHVGAIEQFSTNTDLLSDTEIARKIRSIYR